jgi:hypothetical protein
MLVQHMTGTNSLTFETIVSDLGYKSKNKALEQAWKGLRRKTRRGSQSRQEKGTSIPAEEEGG